MTIALSKVTAQGQISIPAEVRKKLGIGPGSMLEWYENGDQVMVRRAGRYTSADVNRVLFPESNELPVQKPNIGTEDTGKEDGIRKYIRKRHARR